MTTAFRVSPLAACLLFAGAAAAQTPSTPQPSTSQQTTSPAASDESTRPATTTFFGDTGLWYVPTAEVLAGGKWSVSGYRRGLALIFGFATLRAVRARAWERHNLTVRAF